MEGKRRTPDFTAWRTGLCRLFGGRGRLWSGEEIENDRIFQSLDRVQRIGGNDEGLPGLNCLRFPFDDEQDAALLDHADLLIVVAMEPTCGATEQAPPDDGHGVAMDDLARRQGIDLLFFDLTPVVEFHPDLPQGDKDGRGRAAGGTSIPVSHSPRQVR